MSKKMQRARTAIGVTGLIGSVVLVAGATSAIAQKADLKLDPKGAVTARLGYFPVKVDLTTEKPARIVKEPVYKAKPKYATIHLGNGPKSTYIIAVDEPADNDYKIYFDKNQNGDLTDDGNGAWAKKNEGNGRVMYGLNEYTVRASWGKPGKEIASGEYGVAFYRFVGQDYLLMYREAARTGEVKLDGKTHKVLLVENDADGIYNKSMGSAPKPVGSGATAMPVWKRLDQDFHGRNGSGETFDIHTSSDEAKPVVAAAVTRPVWMLLDLNDDGKYGRDETIDVRGPFKLGDKAFEAKIAMDGSTLQILPTKRKVADKPKEQEAPPLLKAGVTAPNFEAEAWGGGNLRLADYKGKVVVLDFWATWCGPCQASMPHVEKVWQAVKDKGVVVLGVCVWDEKAAYEKWVPENKGKYSFKFAYDPAGRDSAKSIAGKLFQVSGIPTTYIIDKDGKVAEAIVGFEEGDKRIEAALKKLGVDAAAATNK